MQKCCSLSWMGTWIWKQFWNYLVLKAFHSIHLLWLLFPPSQKPLKVHHCMNCCLHWYKKIMFHQLWNGEDHHPSHHTCRCFPVYVSTFSELILHKIYDNLVSCNNSVLYTKYLEISWQGTNVPNLCIHFFNKVCIWTFLSLFCTTFVTHTVQCLFFF